MPPDGSPHVFQKQNQGTLIAGPDGEDLVEYNKSTVIFREILGANVCCEPQRFSNKGQSLHGRDAFNGDVHPAQRKRQPAFSTPFEDDDIYGMNMGLNTRNDLEEKKSGDGAFDLSKV
jgi:hypothetical protein